MMKEFRCEVCGYDEYYMDILKGGRKEYQKYYCCRCMNEIDFPNEKTDENYMNDVKDVIK